ncbi:MAG: hypothetical protein H6858_05355 [Rhodospirillales bacterium]|nr:hypothetical protein [Alphaproteobacteria bacterium]MCB1838872.1 hypothetical protein [Alphaproteobacteria bacterium]MCB9977003.1 hypothetical protein [Rhodospirillales bacterium]
MEPLKKEQESSAQPSENWTPDIRKAVETAQQNTSPDIAFFFDAIPQDKLEAAIKSFAGQAQEEEILCLVPSVSSARAGFLLTDQALYFQEVLGSKAHRIPYKDIQSVMILNGKVLNIGGKDQTLNWDITNTLLHEKSRRTVVTPVIAILQDILTGKPGVEMQVSLPDPVNWPRALSFHVPAILIGTPIMAALYKIVSETDLMDHDTGYAIRHLEPDRLMIMSFFALAPTIYAYGTELVFSLGRYIVAAVILALMMMRALAQAGPFVENPGVMPIGGGGIAGILIVSALGFAGLAIYNMVTKSANAPEDENSAS